MNWASVMVMVMLLMELKVSRSVRRVVVFMSPNPRIGGAVAATGGSAMPFEEKHLTHGIIEMSSTVLL